MVMVDAECGDDEAVQQVEPERALAKHLLESVEADLEEQLGRKRQGVGRIAERRQHHPGVRKQVD